MRSALLFLLQVVSFSMFSQQTPDELLKGIEAASNDSIKISKMLDAAWEVKYSNPANAIHYANNAVLLARKNGFKSQLANSHYYKALIFYLTNQFDSTFVSAAKALDLYLQLKNDYGVASIHNVHGLVHERKGDYEESIKSYHRSLEYAKRTSNLYAQSNPLHNIGLIYNKLKEYRQSKDYFLKALEIRKKIGDSVMIAQSFQCIALVDVPLGDTNSAINYNEQAIRYFKKTGDSYDLALVYTNLGTLNTALKKYDKAEELLKEALSLHRTVENKEGEVMTLNNLAELQIALGNFNDAVRYASQSVSLADSLGLDPELKQAYLNLVLGHEGSGDFRNAFFVQKRLATLSDTLLNEEKVKQLALMETRYQAKEKEQQIALQESELKQTYGVIASLVVGMFMLGIIFYLARSQYRKKQALLEADKELSVREAYIQATIESQENERKRFARDLHDGMGQLISALRLSLSAVNHNSSLEERVAVVDQSSKLLNEMHGEIRSVAFNLMPQTLVQYGLVPALKEMADRMNASGTIFIRISSLDLPSRFPEVFEISIYRIIQEWVNNVVKYATPSKIEVQLVGYEREVIITIEDDGKGFDPKTLQESSGNGWKNIRSRINLIKGDLEIDSSPLRSGSTLTLNIPIEGASTQKLQQPLLEPSAG